MTVKTQQFKTMGCSKSSSKWEVYSNKNPTSRDKKNIE